MENEHKISAESQPFEWEASGRERRTFRWPDAPPWMWAAVTAFAIGTGMGSWGGQKVAEMSAASEVMPPLKLDYQLGGLHAKND